MRALVRVAATECHLVGGVLRDRLLGLPVKDIDVVVAGRGEEVARRVAEVLGAHFVALGGKEFAAFRLVAGEYVVDVWDRGGVPLERDLARRDFTVNSMALETVDGDLVDPFGGVSDLERRLLRATTGESFLGDPLRVARLARLVVQLPGFSAEEGTVELGRAAAGGLTGIAAERVREELALIFGQEAAHRGLALLVRLEVYPGLWLGTPGVASGRKAALAVGAVAQLPACAAHLRGLASDLDMEVDMTAARLAATFAALPEALPGADPAAALERFRAAGYVTRAAAEAVRRLLRWDELPDDELGRRKFLHAAGTTWPTVVCLLGAQAAAAGAREEWERKLPPLGELARREGAALVAPPRLLSGEEVQEILGMPPGPLVGRALAAVREAQVAGSVGTKEEAEALVRRLPR